MLKDASRAGNAPAPALRRLGKVWSPGDAIGLLTAAPDPPGSGAPKGGRTGAGLATDEYDEFSWSSLSGGLERL
jgi:hypothetical protein